MLLYYLEEILGGVGMKTLFLYTQQFKNLSVKFISEIFNKYLKAHIEKFKGKSINSDQWKDFLYEYFHDKVSILIFFKHSNLFD